ncbi:MAG: nucleoside hydrolase [Bacteroidia bacterium]
MGDYSRRKFILRGSMAGLLAFSPKRNWLKAAPQRKNTPLPLIVDADTANEVDDLFAIAIALLAPNLNVLGITSAQWHTQKFAPNDSVGASQKLNVDILRLMDQLSVPHPEGANHPLVNTLRPQPSEAADFIIEQAMALPAGEKLHVAILGPATNLAAALLIEPKIAPKVVANYLGFWHDPVQNTWSKREFNTNNDPNAVDVLLNNAQLEFRVMTATSSRNLTFDKLVVDQHLKGKAGIGDYLVERWESYDRFWSAADKEKAHWIMWDVALILALAYPEWGTLSQVITPHDNLRREIGAWTQIDAAKMEAKFWELLDAYYQ